MNSGQSTQPIVTQTQQSSPWIGAQPYLGMMYQTADAMRQAGVGYQPYTGPTMAPIDPQVATSLGQIGGIADLQSNSFIPQMEQGITGLGTNFQNQGITPNLTAVLGFGGGQGLGQAATQYSNVYGQAQGATNPYLLASIADQNRRGNEAIQSSMSAAGRYGSGQYDDVMARAQAEVADPLLMQDYEARQARALQATQGLGQTYGQMAGILQQGMGQAMQGLGMMPALATGEYTPAQMRLSAGQYMQDYQQQALQGQIAQYNAEQAYPWQNLEREAAILAGAGQLGGTTVTAQTPLQAPFTQRLLGGAAVGAGVGNMIAPGLGTAGGAGLGALAGAFL